ncbi:DUF2187 family protein [Cytobacillus gottheilii]|uniref:DUF2187 domain-containing protein n=2 Tax=Bacillaceae TaxID=186817 RepID=A0A7V7UXB4_9BACI|nr:MULTISPECIES: DUF2187 family protein [Bacillaceae]KAB2335620.1 DUF2187 domain-containing protein [Bacillus mesophilum]QVY63494.1 DUF2187 family protein [Cytobacillus gottheilii]
MEEQKSSVKTANIGDWVQVNKGEAKGQKGKVVVLRENSVIIEYGLNEKKDEPLMTVVNHRNYKLI